MPEEPWTGEWFFLIVVMKWFLFTTFRVVSEKDFLQRKLTTKTFHRLLLAYIVTVPDFSKRDLPFYKKSFWAILKISNCWFFVFPEIFAHAFTFFRKFLFFQIPPRHHLEYLLSNAWGEVSDNTNPGIIRADPGYPKDTLFRAQFGLRLPFYGSSLWVPMEVVSTPTENNVINGYLTKITILIAIWPCNLASFCGHLFLAYSLGCFLGETPRKCPWLPAIAITSEKLDFNGFYLVFESLGAILVCGWERVRILSKSIFRKFLTHEKNIFRISLWAVKKLQWNFFWLYYFFRKFFARKKYW